MPFNLTEDKLKTLNYENAYIFTTGRLRFGNRNYYPIRNSLYCANAGSSRHDHIRSKKGSLGVFPYFSSYYLNGWDNRILVLKFKM